MPQKIAFAVERMNVLDATELCIKSLHQGLTFYANGFSVDKICDPLINQPIQIAEENLSIGKILNLLIMEIRDNKNTFCLELKSNWCISSRVRSDKF